MSGIRRLAPVCILSITLVILYSFTTSNDVFDIKTVNIANTTVPVGDKTDVITPSQPGKETSADVNVTRPVDNTTLPDKHTEGGKTEPTNESGKESPNDATLEQKTDGNVTLPTNIDWVPQISVYDFPHSPVSEDAYFTNGTHIYRALIGIPTGPGNSKRRQTLRSKWLQWAYNVTGPEVERIKTSRSRPFPDCLVRFFVAKPSSPQVQEALDKEQEQYGDIVEFTHFPDSYYNLGWKTIAMVQWAELFMKGRYDYLYKVDDDVFVHLPRMLSLLDTMDPVNVYMGFDGGVFIPDKNKKSKWHYPDAAPSIKFHFNCGPGYVLSADVVRKYVLHINKTANFKPIFLEDVNTAYVMAQVGVPVRGNTRMANHDRCSHNMLQLHGAYSRKQDDLYRAVRDKARNMCTYIRPPAEYRGDS